MKKILCLAVLCLVLGTVSSQDLQLQKFLGSDYFKHDHALKAVAVSPDGKLVVCGDETSMVWWNAADGKLHDVFEDLSYGMVAAEYSSDGTMMALEDSC